MLTRDEAYDAMVDYLDPYYFQVLAKDPKSPGDLACVLSEMMLLESDETPMDPAVTEDWYESIDKILNEAQRLKSRGITEIPPKPHSSTGLKPDGFLATANKKSQNWALEEYKNTKLTAEEAYAAMIDFLDRHRKRFESEEIATLMNLMTSRTAPPPITWNDWIRSVDKMSNPKTRARRYIKFFPK